MLLLFLLALHFSGPRTLAQDEPKQPYRIGIVAYDDIKGRATAMSQTFARLGHRVRFAAGTAEEVLDWVSQGLVDIAVLSPGALAATSAVLTEVERHKRIEAGTLPAWDCRYLVTPELPPSKSPFASRARRRGGGFTYQALCLVNRRSLESLRRDFPGPLVDTIRRAAAAHRLQFVFGDPLSLSGTIVPRAQLKALGIDPHTQWEFSFGHKDTLKLLLDEPGVTVGGKPRLRIGFVFDASIPDVPDKELPHRLTQMQRDLVVVPLPAPPEPLAITSDSTLTPASVMLSSTSSDLADNLPAEVWVVRPDFGARETQHLRNQLLRLTFGDSNRLRFRDQSHSPTPPSELQLLASRVKHWARDAGITLGGNHETRPIGIPEIVHSMRHYERRYREIPRLALVLSGGGAKCAYQAGAIESIERQLIEMRDFGIASSLIAADSTASRVPPDIGLVVGTSGGALNALPTAVGVTAVPGGGPLANVWRSIHLTELLQPFPIVKLLLGTFIGLSVLVLTSLMGRTATYILSRRSRDQSRGDPGAVPSYITWSPTLCIRLLLLFSLLGCWWLITHSPHIARTSAPDSWMLYYFLWLPFNISGASTLAVVAFGTVASAVLPRKFRADSIPSLEVVWWRSSAVVILAFGLFVYQAVWGHKALSDGIAMQRMIVSKMLEMLQGTVRANRSKLGDISQQTSALSDAICDVSQARRRDFVMAVSVLGSQGMADRYVYLPATQGGQAPSYDQRAINLQRGSELSFIEDPKQIIPLVIASGTIFPVFPARTFIDPTGRSEDMYVVDGGFAHNIPVEAAVDWGATHIIVVEASPRLDSKESNAFIENIGTAFDHLFAQAQLTDVRSRRRVEIYTLRPDHKILTILDFRPSLIELALNQGRADADAGKFRQYSGPPRLTTFD